MCLILQIDYKGKVTNTQKRSLQLKKTAFFAADMKQTFFQFP
ncbi:hypothetical protein B4092_4984 [Bacillus licheniformis]|nr:hypothetical protein B4092_4984 [Bacillus licheniformis]